MRTIPLLFSAVALGAATGVAFFYALSQSGLNQETGDSRTQSPQTSHSDSVSYIYVDGVPVMARYDRNKDGKVDVIVTYTNNLQSEFEADENFDGRMDAWGMYSNGYIAQVRNDTDFNGIVDVTYSYVFGIIAQAAWTPNGLKFTNKLELFTNGVFFKRLRRTEEREAWRETLYDPFGEPVRENE